MSVLIQGISKYRMVVKLTNIVKANVEVYPKYQCHIILYIRKGEFSALFVPFVSKPTICPKLNFSDTRLVIGILASSSLIF